ncbi:Hypothetical protein GLP15_2041 [Giardia lamblia P15]|uniref:Uncharacterized protein n=1 Tax=Giardia intestinalis (strain P15) TaxID=658858 RepID=E1EZZ4_GIAIA|nr:Hypothetical protein GLP15_2041 [Giardia lamblia P15]
MVISSPSQVLIKAVDNRRTKPTACKGNCPKSGTIDTIEDLERVVADLDKCIGFADIHRIIVSDVTDIRHVVPWFQRENVLGQASRLLSSPELATSSLCIRKRCARMYLILFSVCVMLHDKRLQSSVLESLTTVSLCFDLLIGAHVNLYRMRSLEDSGRFSPKMSTILERLMGLDEFVHEFDRLGLFEEYQKKETEHSARRYVPPPVPAGYSVVVYIHRNSSSPNECGNSVQEPIIKKGIPNEKETVPMPSIDYPPFNFHLLKTNALSTFDLGVYSFLSTLRFHIYQDLLQQANKEHLLEHDIRRFQKLFSLLVYVNRDTGNKEVCEYLEQLFETISSLITYTRICRFILEVAESHQFSTSEIPISCLTSRNTKTHMSSAIKPSVKTISQSLRNIAAAIASCTQQMLQFISWVVLESPWHTTDYYTEHTASDSVPRVSCLFQRAYERMLSLIEEIFMCRACLCFTIFQVDEELVRNLTDDLRYDSTMISYTLDDEGQPPKENSIEYELLRSLYCTGEDALLEPKGIHAAVTSSIDCSALYARKSGEKGQIIIQLYGLLPQLLYGMLYLMNLANIMLPGSNHSRVNSVIQLIEPTGLIITTIFSVLQQNNKSFCRTQLGGISLFLKRFSQAIEAVLSTVHTASRSIYKRIRASQTNLNDNARMEAYTAIINTAFRVLQNMFEAGIVVLDQKLLVMGIRYITSFVSLKSFCDACRILVHLLPYKEMREFAECYTLDGKSVGEYLTERTRPGITDSACLNSLDALLFLINNR